MEYTKSEIWELRSKIDDNLAVLEHYTNIFIPNPQKGLVELCLADNAVMELDAHLKYIKKYCIDEDKYDLAVEIVKKVKPVWERYVNKVTNQKERERLGVMPGHSHFTNIMDTLLNWLDWLNKYEAVPPRSIAEDFFKAFTTVSHDCIMSIGFKYRTRIEKPKLPGIIVQEFDAYRRSKPDSVTLKQVIENQLNTCKTLSETEQYVCSLLLPFKEICEVLRPSTPNNESKLFIKLLCTSAINHEKELFGTVEYCLRAMLNDMNDYALMLYNVLIQNSIDLNEYQQKTGVYFRKEWNPANGMFFNLGDWDLIENLPLVETDEQQASDISVETAGATKTTIEKNDDLKKELGITEKLQSIFYNNEAILQKFLQRTKGKKGARIVDDVWALIQMGKIDNEEAGEDLRQELLSLGYDTTTKQNWSDQLGKRRHDVVFEKIKKEYQSEGNSTKE